MAEGVCTENAPADPAEEHELSAGDEEDDLAKQTSGTGPRLTQKSWSLEVVLGDGSERWV